MHSCCVSPLCTHMCWKPQLTKASSLSSTGQHFQQKGVCVCVCARLPVSCTRPSRQSVRFFLGRLCWHDLDGALLCGRQGPPPSGISLCTEIGFKRKRKKRKSPHQAPALALREESTALGSEPPTLPLMKSTSLPQGFLCVQVPCPGGPRS